MKETKVINEMKLSIDSRSVNESFARVAVSAFAAQLDLTIGELNDIKTAVSEAVTNCIVHAYEDSLGKIYITCSLTNMREVIVKIRDLGRGIEDIEQARKPLFTTGGDDRMGLGFAVMETFMDSVRVVSRAQKGTTVTLKKQLQLRTHGSK
jgi:stage II sporulation protein AB (anti-sigma F factor)